MRLLVTGGSGVLGTAFLPLAREAGHEIDAPAADELDLCDAAAVAEAVRGHGGVVHLATRIPRIGHFDDAEAWRQNDRLRAEASALLVDAALAASSEVYVQPTVAFVYPPDGPTTEDTPIGAVEPTLRSGLVAEEQTARFAAVGRRGVVLRFGLLDGPGTGHDEPVPVYGSTLDVRDAGRALLSALTLPSGIYNVCRDGERVSTDRFAAAAGWRPRARGPRNQPSSRVGDRSAYGSTSPRRIA
jgi:nucleoside-diphosphate-sugar epimerase